MIGFIIISAFFLALAAFASAVMDKLQHHYSTSIFSKFENQQFWNPVVSWRNKYKNFDPEQGPKFWLSTTLFVAFTDGWHLAKFVMSNSYVLAFTISTWALFGAVWFMFPVIFVSAKLIQIIVFHFSYHKIFVYKPPEKA